MVIVDMGIVTAIQDTKATTAKSLHHVQKVVVVMVNAGMGVVTATPHFLVQDVEYQLSAQKVVVNVVFVSAENVNAKWVSVVRHVKLPLHQKDAQKIAQSMVIAVWENVFAIQTTKAMIVHVT